MSCKKWLNRLGKWWILSFFKSIIVHKRNSRALISVSHIFLITLSSPHSLFSPSLSSLPALSYHIYWCNHDLFSIKSPFWKTLKQWYQNMFKFFAEAKLSDFWCHPFHLCKLRLQHISLSRTGTPLAWRDRAANVLLMLGRWLTPLRGSCARESSPCDLSQTPPRPLCASLRDKQKNAGARGCA